MPTSSPLFFYASTPTNDALSLSPLLSLSIPHTPRTLSLSNRFSPSSFLTLLRPIPLSLSNFLSGSSSLSLPPSRAHSLSLSLPLSLSIPTASPPPSSTVYENNTFLRSIHSSSFLFSLSNLAPSFSLPRSRRYTPPCLTNGILPFPLLAVDQSSLFPQRCSS